MASNNGASKLMYSAPAAKVVFEYTGNKCAVPKDVTIARFHPFVTKVEDDAFRECLKLREVVFNDGLQKIGKRAFYYCTLLPSITIPSTVTEISDNAFQDCSNLRNVALNEGLQKIGMYAFYYCPSLERFTFPALSTRLDNLIQSGHWEEIEVKVNEVRGVVERSGGELFVLSTQSLREGGNNWIRVRESLNRISRLISYYELKGGTSIFELALWKFKLDQQVVDKTNPSIRKKCRMDVPGPVKNVILQYLS